MKVIHIIEVKNSIKKTIINDCLLNGAGSGNRTHLSSLEGWSITDIRYPPALDSNNYTKY